MDRNICFGVLAFQSLDIDCDLDRTSGFFSSGVPGGIIARVATIQETEFVVLQCITCLQAHFYLFVAVVSNLDLDFARSGSLEGNTQVLVIDRKRSSSICAAVSDLECKRFSVIDFFFVDAICL